MDPLPKAAKLVSIKILEENLKYLDERISNLAAHQNSTALKQVEFEERVQGLEEDLKIHKSSEQTMYETRGERIKKLEQRVAAPFHSTGWQRVAKLEERTRKLECALEDAARALEPEDD
jgi:hypothetical protein